MPNFIVKYPAMLPTSASPFPSRLIHLLRMLLPARLASVHLWTRNKIMPILLVGYYPIWSCLNGDRSWLIIASATHFRTGTDRGTASLNCTSRRWHGQPCPTSLHTLLHHWYKQTMKMLFNDFPIGIKDILVCSKKIP